MLDTPRRGFTVQYASSVKYLTAPLKITPLLTIDSLPSGKTVEITALWDTGATVTCIKPSLWERLKMLPYNIEKTASIAGVGGTVTSVYTIVKLFLSDNFEISFCPVYKVDFPSGADMIIGMNVIGMGDFAVCNAGGMTSFSFAVPPFPDRVDFTKKTRAENPFA